jgi:regulatory protein YycI of two-component signal transduction system YycFG
MNELISKVEVLKKECYLLERVYDVDGIHNIMSELRAIEEPYISKMNELSEDSKVKEYLSNKNATDYISNVINCLISCLPK